MILLSENTTTLRLRFAMTAVFDFLYHNQWLFVILIVIEAFTFILNIYKMRTQFKFENNIEHMFNEDGNRTYFRDHKKYDFLTPLFLLALTTLFWIVVHQM